MKSHSEQFLRQRKLMTALPVLVLPFVTMLFWALDGGKQSHADTSPIQKGLNTEVPGAKLENTPKWDKLSLYEQAQRDSLKKAEAERTDPYFRLRTITEIAGRDSIGFINHSLGKKEPDLIRTEKEATEKINAIKALMGAPDPKIQKPHSTNITHEGLPQADESIDRLEEMMLLMQETGGSDPELHQIEGVLEKILDVQHPERIEEKLREQSTLSPTRVFNVSKATSILEGKFFGRTDSLPRIGTFYGGTPIDTTRNNLINAVTVSDQTLSDKSIIKLRLEEEIFVSGQMIPKGSYLFGICKVESERISIRIASLFFNNSLYPVDLAAFDMDGLQGLYVPGTVGNDAVKQGSNQALQDLQIMSMDPSIGAQAANAGIQTAKSLIGKRTRITRVLVKSGYRVLLKDLSKKSH